MPRGGASAFISRAMAAARARAEFPVRCSSRTKAGPQSTGATGFLGGTTTAAADSAAIADAKASCGDHAATFGVATAVSIFVGAGISGTVTARPRLAPARLRPERRVDFGSTSASRTSSVPAPGAAGASLDTATDSNSAISTSASVDQSEAENATSLWVEAHVFLKKASCMTW
eukprot:CAMPEP_0203892598 /NCGR_PEP_ID=MMETSP0359-20131031/35779_1 /ASSEMBLY_ACC=CAM_ASM_000338 /TAXON_ID=268821 /ORGANISM="Scrippsiella Hangoei, Strain SHTV-5" /LENGTH=172 /DNA_ID=CAMNT_0050814595 /DNA_START=30 /DNA_END=548 /DNA_ORIENTATION=-